VLGPTGSGKSALALEIARQVGGEIVGCDSVQVYRGFDIGTAKVSRAERRGVPHHLIDLVDATAVFTAGEYARVARDVLRDIAARGRVPIVVGGTGFYLRALLEGLSPGPERDPDLRERLAERERRRPGSLHRILTRLDSKAAGRIHPNDRNKTMRALEVCLLERRPMTALFEQGRDPLTGFRTVKLGLDPPREKLYARLNERTRRMFERGLLDEVHGLIDSGVPQNAKPLQSLGYRQALDAIEGRATLAQAIEATEVETRQYAKRQLTWFRLESAVRWFQAFGDDPGTQREALTIVSGCRE